MKPEATLDDIEIAGRKLVSLDDWHRRAAAGDKAGAPSGVLLRRVFTVRAKPVEGLDRTIEIVIGTSAQDRYRDVIETAGYETANYLLNPVVLWAHDYYSPPVGKAVAVFTEGEKLVARDQFCEPGLYPFGDMVYRMLLAGFLNAASVGIDPLEWTYDEEMGGVRFYRHELLEHSIVPVPANPEALARAKAAGIDLQPMDEWARKALDMASGGETVAVSRASLEATVKALGFGRGLKFFELGAAEIKAKVAAKVKGDTVDEPEEPAKAEPTEPAGAQEPAADEPEVETPPAADEPPPAEASAELTLGVAILTADQIKAAVRAELEAMRAELPTGALAAFALGAEAASNDLAALATQLAPAAPENRLSPDDLKQLAAHVVPAVLQPLQQAVTAVTGRVFEP